MKRIVTVTCVTLMWLTGSSAGLTTTLCNPNATEEAQRVFMVLNQLYGERIVSATMADVNWNNDEARNVHKWTGRWPAMNVLDFIHAHAAKDVNPQGWINYKDTSVARTWWRNGGIVGAMWHWNVRDNSGTGWTCTPGTGDDQTTFDVSRISDTESDEYKQVIKDLDQIATYLLALQKLNIPVVWRPLHEAAGNTYEYSGGKAWFWWGAKGAEPYKQLWRLMYDRFVNHHGLNNLIWVWTSQMGDRTWYPGNEYVDIVGRDNYGIAASKARSEFSKLKSTFPTKMIVLAECGHSGSKRMATVGDMWNSGAQWGWFMTWYDHDYTSGTSGTHRHTDAAWWQAAWDSGIAVDRAGMKQLLDDAVGIKDMGSDGTVKSEKLLNNQCFDLAGRRVVQHRKGMYIVNGKKFLLNVEN